MRDNLPHLRLDPDASLPLHLRICRTLAGAIETGCFKPGDVLPGSRALAEQFNVSRNTVVLALSLLEAQGWIEVHPKRGSVVSSRPRQASPLGWEQGLMSDVSEGTPVPFDWTVTRDDVDGPRPESVRDLRKGVPDARLFPAAELGRFYKRALERKQGETLINLDYKGQSDLRKALASWLTRRRGLHRGPENLVTTTGLAMSVELLAKATLWNPGIVAMETPGPPEVRTFFEHKRVGILGIPVDGDGMQVEALAEYLESGVPIRLLILSTACQSPTGCRLSEPRRELLLDLVQRYSIVVAENEGCGAWYTETPPPLPLAHFDRTGKIVYMGSFADWLAPGIHAGFIYARRSVADRLAGLKKNGST